MLCASVGNKKGSVLLMHGVTMKFEVWNVIIITVVTASFAAWLFLLVPEPVRVDLRKSQNF